ncbi:uncharacterized protein B0I36DRAFT_101573 [Microdochium trichocladiopsis]|uniref:Glycerophosphocholine acyltransferase 1 n=1 Tax=Microdochium trichocladiopsis TaxID=1682393 RepID=A0A9P8Y8D0_9PEZI|nr:uncharacterized protein B0I36DRAFT_101573 [Microdochium trichocladiopsis]KAH7032868.1 hypothetical protein B0I36DRAFT_101573 [Microdochium trichocladiopsis]
MSAHSPVFTAGIRDDKSGGDAGSAEDEAPALSPSSSPSDEAVSTSTTPRLDPITPSSPRLSRNGSFSGSSSYHEDWDSFPPLDRLTVLDLLDNFALPQQLERLQRGLSAQTEKVRKSRAAFQIKSQEAKGRMVEEWRRRVPSAEEQLEKYRTRMKKSVDKLGKRWGDTKTVTLREKVSFICGVMNVFISGYLIGAHSDWFHVWYTTQLIYFMPIRYYTYHSRGYHYFLADLCYFVNVLLFLSIWVFPSSKRLFLASYCLAHGNNAVAIIMWRNSLVFHDFDKVTSLFIHIMPCATLHCITHLYPLAEQAARFPALFQIKTASPGSSAAYGNLVSMLAWSTIPYAVWQLSYYYFITVRRREKIAAGRPTSFTWLRRSYSKTWIGKLVLSLPEALQEAAFMLIQYAYAVLTMLPCPLWFYSRWMSGVFLMVVFTWSIYNGSTFYIDVFGKRFQKELESLKAEVAQWQNNPEHMLSSPVITPQLDADGAKQIGAMGEVKLGDPAGSLGGRDPAPIDERTIEEHAFNSGVTATGIDGGAMDVARERK